MTNQSHARSCALLLKNVFKKLTKLDKLGLYRLFQLFKSFQTSALISKQPQQSLWLPTYPPYVSIPPPWILLCRNGFKSSPSFCSSLPHAWKKSKAVNSSATKVSFLQLMREWKTHFHLGHATFFPTDTLNLDREKN